MSARRPNRPVLALRQKEAAAALGLSEDSFVRHVRHVRPQLRVVRFGGLRLFPVAELERWLERNAAVALEDER